MIFLFFVSKGSKNTTHTADTDTVLFFLGLRKKQ